MAARVVAIARLAAALVLASIARVPQAAAQHGDAVLAAVTAAAAAQATAPSAAPARYEPPSSAERGTWLVGATIGPGSLLAGAVSAGWGTARNNPDEYGGQWAGFGKRYVVRLSGVAIGNSIEAVLGAVTGEDPRYERLGAGSVWRRVGHAASLTVRARRRDGTHGPAYARYAAIVGNNLITNAWRTTSESSGRDALTRSATGLLGRFVGHLIQEFRPTRREPAAALAARAR
jgi:hypothetical protein